jgi:putative heme transporter
VTVPGTAAESAPDQPTAAPAPRGQPPRGAVPSSLRTAAAWAWRLLVLGAALYVLIQLVARLRVVVIPVLIGLLIAALTYPIASRLRRHGVPRLAAAWVALLTFLLAIAGVGVLIGYNATSEFPHLSQQVNQGVDRVQDYLTNGPFHFSHKQIDDAVHNIRASITRNRSRILSGVLAGASVAVEVVTGVLLALFTAFFLLYDGERIWHWVVTRFPPRVRDRVRGAGDEAWSTVTGYIRGTMFVAFTDAVGISIGLLVVGVPLVAPLALLTFIGGFIPIVGATLAGVASVLVTLVAKGPVPALIVLGVVLAVQQLEGHVLQPVVMRRAVRLHPLAIVLSLAAGATLAGIPGAVVAVPFVAVINRVSGFLARFGKDEAPPDG